MNPDIFIITSVINTGNTPWSYTGMRSCYTKEERLGQTLNTINSIRKLNDNSLILLVECSDIDESITNILKSSVDFFIQTYDNPDVRYACVDTNKKGFGEVMKLEQACKFIKNNYIKFNRLFKISGRYYLNESFNKNNYDTNDKFTFKMYGPDSGSTVLYSVPFLQFESYIENIIKLCNYYLNNPPTGLETIVPNICQPRNEIETLGVSGYVGVLDDNGKSSFYTA